MNRLKIFVALLFLGAFLFQSCVKDELFVDTNVDSDVVLVINEVNSNAGDPNPDWIEIYNPGSEAVDISGFGVYDSPSALFPFPAGTTVPAGGYFVVVCDKLLAGGDPTNIAAFGIKSTGESVFLVDAAGAVIDEVAVPAMPLDVTYARIPDGGTVWANANATKAAANSNTNEAPVITATLIPALDDNNAFDISVVAFDAGGVRDVKLYLDIDGDVKLIELAPVSGGMYKYRIAAMPAGTVVKYYVVATDETGKKSYFPDTAPATPATITVANGAPKFVSVTLSNENPSADEAVNFTVSAYDKTGVKEVKLYYVLNNGTSKTTITLTADNDKWIGTIPGQTDGTKIRYYLRVEDLGGLKTYYPVETVVDGVVTSAFNHDVTTTWPEVNVAPLQILEALVINEVNASGSPYDFIELYNGTNSAINLEGYKVHDSGGLGAAYVIPAGVTIASKGFFVIQTGNGSPQGQFGISSGGENLTLLNPSDVKVDELLTPWVGTPLVARKLDGAVKWVVPTTETKGITNNPVAKK